MLQDNNLSATAPSASPTHPAETQSIPSELDDIEFDVVTGYTLADAIRDGAKETDQTQGWGDGVTTACALTAAQIAIRNKGYDVR